VCGFAQLGFLIRRFARGGHKLVYVQSQSGFLQAVRAVVEREELLYVMIVQKSVGACSNMLEKTEEGNSYRLESESRITYDGVEYRMFRKMIDVTCPANATDCMDFFCRGSHRASDAIVQIRMKIDIQHD
jgi:hypothetical protein